jgi:hypothetical protein
MSLIVKWFISAPGLPHDGHRVFLDDQLVFSILLNQGRIKLFDPPQIYKIKESASESGVTVGVRSNGVTGVTEDSILELEAG